MVVHVYLKVVQVHHVMVEGNIIIILYLTSLLSSLYIYRCTFVKPRDTLVHGYCNGHNCDIEGVEHPILHGDEYLTL